MKPVVYKVIWLGLLLPLVLACAVGTVQAQSEERGAQPTQPVSQAGGMPGQGGMEGMQGNQAGIGQMT